MKVYLEIKCECGNETSMEVKVEEHVGASITNSIRNNPADFGAIQYHEDDISITCGKCKKEFELGT